LYERLPARPLKNLLVVPDAAEKLVGQKHEQRFAQFAALAISQNGRPMPMGLLIPAPVKLPR